MADQTRFVFISGGVISGLGKGIVTASLGALLKARGYAVAAMKIDAYLNQDAGTMNPVEHGEVFVTADGLETDQDLGHYERFGLEVDRHCYATMGSVLRELLDQERSLTFQGKTVELVPHVPNEVIRRIEACGAAHEADFVLVELGGTVGEYQIQLFLEAARVMTKKHRGRVAHVHVGYMPFVESLGEMKSKPVQLAVQKLYECGIQPDFLVLRSAARHRVDQVRTDKIAGNTNLDPGEIILAPDVTSIYEVPLLFEEQKLAQKLLKKLGVEVVPRARLSGWKRRVEALKAAEKTVVRIGIVEKYIGSGEYSLPDSYVSVLEALRHVEANSDVRVLVEWIHAEYLEDEDGLGSALDWCDGVLVPQGWGSRGAEGKINAIRYCREQGIPFFGICYGFQMAVVEFARHVAGLTRAHSAEVDPKTPEPVIQFQAGQEARVKQGQYGGTLRKGTYECLIHGGTHLSGAYRPGALIQERHRHRYEFNHAYFERLDRAGLRVSGCSPGGELIEAVELPRETHPFFVGVQFHPEYQSRFEAPHPLFRAFVEACAERVKRLNLVPLRQMEAVR